MEGRYRFEEGTEGVRLRVVEPYMYEYQTHCKLPWRNKQLLAIFRDHFKAYSKDYYTNAISSGAITVSGSIVSPEYKVRNGDVIEHRTLRREPPVLALPITIEYDLPNILVVCKPPSMPTHLCGSYKHNSMLGILENEKGMKGLKPVHRLDRVTSGVIVLAKNSKTATVLMNMMKEDMCEKWYVAKVAGNFPTGETRVNAAIHCLSKADGRYGISPDGKPSETLFYREKYFEASNTTVVLCKPITGRTHQIRLHLQHLGFPIANDGCYGGHSTEAVADPHRGEKRVRIGEAGENEGIEMEETSQMMIFLHAFRYKLTQNLDFEVSWPKWALEDVNEY